MFLATQYYRPPFPERRFRADDMARIRDAGLHAVQLWCLWGWIEAEPGRFRYDDYDELFDLADKAGLKVVLSTLPEIQPFWIHRLVPDAHLVDHPGRAQVSTPRNECNTGITPGGCWDHPRVREMIGRFLGDIASRYAGRGNLLAWDCWNETRWNIHADGYTCYCPHTLAAFRDWLGEKYGDLDGLNAAWKRRYVSWEDVAPPKRLRGPYVGIMEFQKFITVRAARHAKFRYEAIKAADGRHPVTIHGPWPAVMAGGDEAEWEMPLGRGNDWDFADELDGVGSSHFPGWQGMKDELFLARLESVRSAGRGKITWISELQGGASRSTIDAQPPISPATQQRWIAQGLARGVKGVIFWCWRDEVFCTEASGFGLSGWDGQAERRLAALRRAGAFLDAHGRLLDAYRPDAPRIGVLFTPEAYYLRFAAGGHCRDPLESQAAYAMALERLGLPYTFVEAHHADEADALDVLLMPWPLIVPDAARKAALRLLRRGGRLLVEAEADAYDALGWYRYPDERPLMRALGLHDLGRRPVGPDPLVAARLGEDVVELPIATMRTPLDVRGKTEALATTPDGEAMLVRRPVGKGAAYVLGGFAGIPYHREFSPGLERLIGHVCADAGVAPAVEIEAGPPGASDVFWRTGTAGKKRLLWLINRNESAPRTVTVVGGGDLFTGRSSAGELVTGEKVRFERDGGGKRCTVCLPESGWAVLAW